MFKYLYMMHGILCVKDAQAEELIMLNKCSPMRAMICSKRYAKGQEVL